MTFEEVTAFLDDPFFGSTCFDCHRTQGDLPYVFKKDDTLYDTLVTSTIAHCNDRKLVEPGNAEESALYLVLYGDCENVAKMPHGCYESPDGFDNSCAPYEARERLRLWIEAGAPKE